jgi:hypothetical protein
VLEIEKIDYAVIGAMAASPYGVAHASLDADAVMSLTVQQAPALEKKFRAAGFLMSLNRDDPEDPIPAVPSVADSFQTVWSYWLDYADWSQRHSRGRLRCCSRKHPCVSSAASHHFSTVLSDENGLSERTLSGVSMRLVISAILYFPANGPAPSIH